MPATDFKIGLNCNTYYNTGTYASPTLVKLVNIKDEDLDISVGEADMSRRASQGWEEIVTTLKKGTFNFEMIYKKGDTAFAALFAAVLANTAYEYVFADGEAGTALSVASGGTAGVLALRATCYITGFKSNRKLTDGVSYPFTRRVGDSDNNPSLVTIA